MLIITGFTRTLVFKNVCSCLLKKSVKELLEMEEISIGTRKIKVTRRWINGKLRWSTKQEFKGRITCAFVLRNIVSKNDRIKVVVLIVMMVLLAFGVGMHQFQFWPIPIPGIGWNWLELAHLGVYQTQIFWVLWFWVLGQFWVWVVWVLGQFWVWVVWVEGQLWVWVVWVLGQFWV